MGYLATNILSNTHFEYYKKNAIRFSFCLSYER
nr:MAG TPA: hypothetical protein [Caudoviricetes sp.]